LALVTNTTKKLGAFRCGFGRRRKYGKHGTHWGRRRRHEFFSMLDLRRIQSPRNAWFRPFKRCANSSKICSAGDL